MTELDKILRDLVANFTGGLLSSLSRGEINTDHHSFGTAKKKLDKYYKELLTPPKANEENDMSDINKSFTITLPSNHDGDDLVECILLLRIAARTYPKHFDIAYQALEREYNSPPDMLLAQNLSNPTQS